MKHLSLSFVVTLAFVFGAAGAVNAASPCSILTNAEASHYLGVAATGHLTGNQCQYRGQRGTIMTLGVALVTGPTANAQFQAGKQGSTPLNGVGYPAYFAAGSVLVMKNGTVVVVSLIRNMHETTVMDPQLPALVRLVLSRI